MAAGDIYRVTLQYELFGYAIDNTLHFESEAGWNTAAEVATEFTANFNDQWMQYMNSDQRLRKVIVKRLLPTPDDYIWTGGFPYFHGSIATDVVSDPRLAATLLIKSGTHSRFENTRVYYGALSSLFESQGWLSDTMRNNFDGLMTWLFTNYGAGGTKLLAVGTWSRTRAAFPGGPPAFTPATHGVVSRRVAVIHSRRTGAGI